jgi:hypothetical protein
MKLFYLLSLSILTLMLFSCEKEKSTTSISGGQSPMGEVGVTVSGPSTSVAGVSNIAAEVISVTDGVSTLEGSATVNNAIIKNVLENLPYVSFDGNKMSVTAEVKVATDGIELMDGPLKGVIVNYSSPVGDEYAIDGSSKTRKVFKHSSEDDYQWGFWLLKVVGVEEPTDDYEGIQNLKYYANHKYGLVGVDVTFDDESTVTCPIFTSVSAE